MKNLVPIKQIFNEKKVTKKLVQSLYDEDMDFILRLVFIPEICQHFNLEKKVLLPKEHYKVFIPFFNFKVLYYSLTKAKTEKERQALLQKYFNKVGKTEAKLVFKLLSGAEKNKHPKLAKIVKQLYNIENIFKPYKPYNKKAIQYPATVIGIPLGIRVFIFVQETGQVQIALENFITITFPDLINHFEHIFKKLCLTNIVLEGILTFVGKKYKATLPKHAKYKGVKKYKIFVVEYLTKDEYDGKVKTTKLVRDSRLQQLLSKIKNSVLTTTSPMIAENEQQLLKYLATKKYFNDIYALLIGDPNSYITNKNTYTIYYNNAKYIFKLTKIGTNYIECESSDGRVKALVKKGVTKDILDKLKILPKNKQGIKITFLQVYRNYFKLAVFISCGYLNEYIDSRTDCIEKIKNFKKEIKQ